MKKTFAFSAFLFLIPVAALVISGCSRKESTADELIAKALGGAINGNWKKCADFAAEASKKDKSNPDALILMALAMNNADKLEDALENISSAVKMAPENFQAHYIKGFLHYKKKHYNEAVKSLRAARKLRPDDANSTILLAQSYLALKNDTMAAAYYGELAKMRQFANNPVPWNALGIIYAKNNPRRAALFFAEADKRSKDNPSPITALNTAVFNDANMRNRLKAGIYYERFLKLTADKPEYSGLRDKVMRRIKELR